MLHGQGSSITRSELHRAATRRITRGCKNVLDSLSEHELLLKESGNHKALIQKANNHGMSIVSQDFVDRSYVGFNTDYSKI
jgi:hypothetical protein